MTPQQIVDDLRPHVRGPVQIDDVTRRLFSTDASPFQIIPAAVFTPLDAADVQAAARFCFEQNVSLTPRGAGTGLAGECLNSGLIIDTSVQFRRILEIGQDTIRVECGVTLREINEALAPLGRRFAIDLPNAEVVTVGGMIGTNASGRAAARHGTVADHVLSLSFVHDDGTAATIARPQSRDESPREILLRGLLVANGDIIRAGRSRAPLSRAGYRLHDVLTPRGIDLIPLLTGSEGTLAITLEATLKTIPIARSTAYYILAFASFDEALDAGLRLRRCLGVVAATVDDQRRLALCRSGTHDLAIPPEANATLTVMVEADDALAAAKTSLESLSGHFMMPIPPTTDPDVIDRVAAFLNAVSTIGSGKHPEPFVEDFGVPPEHLAPFIATVQQLLRESELTASIRVQVLTGVVDCRPILDLIDPADQAKAWPLANRLHDLVTALGGTISARHGCGLARTPWIEKQFPALLPVFREVKRIFDPRNILNPGKIIGPDPSRPAWIFHAPRDKPATPLLLLEEPQLAAELRNCTNCGDCRTRTPPDRMCPMFRVTGTEAATPRAKANLMRLMAAEPLDDAEVKSVAKLCIQCTRCRSECPQKVDIPSLMLEAKAGYFAGHGHDRGEWLIARTERLAALAGTFAFTANALLSWKWSRWLMERLIGLSRRRMLHRFTHRTFLRRRFVQRLFRRELSGSRKFAYFVDTFANYNDPLIAEATIAVLEHHGYSVHVPRRQRGSGMPFLTVGDVERARATAAYNVRTLVELVRDGYTVICSEPTAALAIRTEYPRLLNSDDARLVAEHTIELTALLAELPLTAPTRPLAYRVGHHVPCHLKSLGIPQSPAILSRIPDLELRTIDVGCSGSAGSWGLAKNNFDTSLTIGEPVFHALTASNFGSTECGSCRMQLQQGAGVRVLHPIQWLALAYGLVPQLESRLARPLHPRLTG